MDFGHIKRCLLQPFLPWSTEIALQLAMPTKDNQRNASIHPPRAENQKTVSLCTLAAHFFSTPKARMMGTGILSRSPPMSKFCSDLWVCAPHSLPETEHNSRKPSDQPQHLSCRRHQQIKTTRDKLDQRDKAAMHLWGQRRNHALVVGDLDGTEGVALLAEAGGDRAGQRRPE